MSFQGDVGGIGLGELLQSLSRSNREGILTLNGKGGLVSTLGIQSGLIFLLPNREEDGEGWRSRARRAWADDQDFRVDGLRMSEIAKAHRTEMLYQLLDSEGVHFRFEPGAFSNDAVSTDADGQGRAPSVHCDGIAVEFLLLEYARIQDESTGAALETLPSDQAIPRTLDPASAPKAYERLFKQCDGTSSIEEISDRLGAPLRQTRLSFGMLFKSGCLRFAQPRELLVLFEKELRHGHFSRAAARVSAWCSSAMPGPLTGEDALLIGKEWDTTRLPAMLHSMSATDARTLMKRLDLAINDAYTSIVHWSEMERVFPHDAITKLRLLSWQQKDTGDPEIPSIRDLLDRAREFRDSGHAARSIPLLRVAAARLPNTTTERLELGTGMLQAELIEEGLPWILEASRTLIESGDAEKAISTLRLAVEAQPTNREARKLLSNARANSVRGRSIRRNAFIALGITVLFGGMALVQVRIEQDRDQKMAEVSNMLGNPDQALRVLNEYFPVSTDPVVNTMRDTINERRRVMEHAASGDWNALYRDAQLESTLGDPLLGLQRALDLPAPPKLALSDEPFPLISDLFNGLAARLETEIEDLGAPEEDQLGQVHTEQRLVSLVDDLLAFTAEQERGPELAEFDLRLSATLEVIGNRIEERAKKREERLHKEKLDEQDLIVGAARAHANAGDWTRAVASYERLLDSAVSDRKQLERLLKEEIEDARTKAEALTTARSLSAEGKHAEARELLSELFQEELSRYQVPWTLNSFPQGARVKFPDGTVRSTPVVIDSGFDELLSLRIELSGFESREIEIDDPTDLTLNLSRVPELRWRTEKPVEAMPVSSGPDHILSDRAGRITRLRPDGSASWAREMSSLGGIARAPVFLPDKPGFLLLLTEDGDAWILDAESGKPQGPWPVESPPASGPVSGSRGVSAYFADGRTLLWRDRIKPATVSAGEASILMPERTLEKNRQGTTTGFEVLRRNDRESRTRLVSSWTDWSAEVRDGVVHVELDGLEGSAFKVLLEGTFEYIAWQAPYSNAPSGRLWVSDGQGIRSFKP